MFIANKIFIINKVNSTKNNNKLIKRFIESKTKKLFKFQKSKSKKLAKSKNR